ncbi:EamA family transporter [Leptobacterium flavescens]|uniref:EamA family transporter n=1 Tax=Leptobacterium flavescens TaxID=472055 RepID=A0A6P0UJF9_9FLAO|nr:DMT family transporter [Leptobacterium flavescens]NER13435.1 EamA family transporter [Leptobacterium flavescens]
MELRKAIYFMILSTLAFTGMNGLIKYLTEYTAYQLVFFRSVGSLVFTFGYLFRYKVPLLGNNRKLLLVRGLVGVTAMSLFFMAVHYMPIGSAVALRYTSPIFAAIFAVLLLRETIKPLQWLFFAIAFAGVLVLKGFNGEISTIGIVLGLISALFSGFVYIIIRRLGKAEHPVVIVNYFMCVATLVGGILSIFNWIPPTFEDTLLLLSLGVFGFFGQLFMTKAFQLGETNVIAPIKYVEVVFAILVGVGFLGETYSWYSVTGMAMIIGGLLLNLWYKSNRQ